MTLRLPFRTKALDEVNSPEREVLKSINQPGLMSDDNRGLATADIDVTQGFPAWCEFPTHLDDWTQTIAVIESKCHDRSRSASAH
jgi:hypothetical protein